LEDERVPERWAVALAVSIGVWPALAANVAVCAVAVSSGDEAIVRANVGVSIIVVVCADASFPLVDVVVVGIESNVNEQVRSVQVAGRLLAVADVGVAGRKFAGNGVKDVIAVFVCAIIETVSVDVRSTGTDALAILASTFRAARISVVARQGVGNVVASQPRHAGVVGARVAIVAVRQCQSFAEAILALFCTLTRITVAAASVFTIQRAEDTAAFRITRVVGAGVAILASDCRALAGAACADIVVRARVAVAASVAVGGLDAEAV